MGLNKLLKCVKLLDNDSFSGAEEEDLANSLDLINTFNCFLNPFSLIFYFRRVPVGGGGGGGGEGWGMGWRTNEKYSVTIEHSLISKSDSNSNESTNKRKL